MHGAIEALVLFFFQICSDCGNCPEETLGFYSENYAPHGPKVEVGCNYYKSLIFII